MYFTKRMVLLVATFCFFAGLAHAQAVVNETQETSVIYVDIVNGNDSNLGTQALPLQHIATAAAIAETNNHSSIGTHVYINPGLYRENINLTGNQRETSLPETFEAVTPGTVLISGADQYTNWTQTSGNSSIYSTPWTYDFGLCPPLTGQAPPQTDIILRREMAVVNGTYLEQVLSLNQMLQGTFYVDDSGQQLYIWPPSGTNLSTADVELADRGQLWTIANKNGVVLRGLTFEYSADCKGQGSVDVIDTGTQNVLIDTDNFLWNNATGLHFSLANNYTVENVVANHNGAVGMEMFETLNALVQNTTADYNNWRGGQGQFLDWAEGGINPYGLANGTFTNTNTDWNISTGIHWDTDLANINATNVNARNNLFHGFQLERNTGPMILTGLISCNNANEALEANGASTTAAGIALRDSENVTLTNSFVYGNGNAQLNVIGEPGGIPILNWQTGQIVTVFNENFTSMNNVFESTDETPTVLDPSLGGSDWTLFQSTLVSGQNTWWNPITNTPFILPVPVYNSATTFAGWQSATGQDLTSTFAQPTGNQEALCTVAPDGPDLWAISNVPSLNLDPSGQATATYTYIPIGGFDGGTLSLTMDGISEIPGLSATLTPTTIPNSSGRAVFSATATTAIAPGTYQFTVLANSGSTTRTTEAFLYVPQTSLRFSPSMTFNFGSVQAGQQSSPQTLTISNFGSSAMNNVVIGAAPVGFLITSTTCGSTLAAGASCTVNMTFAPNSGSSYNSPLTITDSDPTSPQTVALIGTGIAAAQISQSSFLLAYGTVVYGLNAAQVVTLTNTGTVNASISPASFSGAGASSYSQTNNCEPSLAVGASCIYTITFAPQALGQLQAALTIPDNTQAGSNAVNLNGTGKTAVTVNPLGLTFGTVAVTNTASKTTTLTNAGNALPVTFALSDNVNYSQTNTCGSSVPANSSCTITVTFAPTDIGTFNATLTINDSDPTSPQVATLTGTGTAAVTPISATPISLTYGNVAWAKASAKTVTVKNNGTVTAFFSSFTFTGTGANDYSQTNTCGISIAPHAQCTVTVTLTPQVLGSLPATLTIDDNNNNVGGNNTVALTGTGITSVVLNPKSLSFGSVEEGSNVTKTTTLTNAGNALPVTIALGDNVNYSQTNTCGSAVPAGGSCVITVKFAPQTSGPLNSTLSITDADPTSPQQVTTTATGLSNLTTVSLTPSPLTYGTVIWGLTSTKTATLKNNGLVNANIGAFTFSGSPDYTQTNNCPATLAPKASCTVNVTFAPNAIGSLNGSLSVADNTTAGATTITMTGTGKTSITVSPFSLSFGHQAVGTSSAPKTVTFTNAGNAIALAISLGGANPQDWSYTTTCGPTVPAKGSCTLSVTFTPQVTGSLAANVVFTDPDPTGPQIAAMTGSGQ